MKLSRTVTYAIQAIVELGSAGVGVVVPSRRLAEAGHIPDRFLLQILRNLVSHGILHSTRGVVGGYTLARNLDQVSLLDIVEAIEGPVRLELSNTSPSAPRPDAEPRSCALQDVMHGVSEGVRRELAGLKLSHLLAARQPREVNSNSLGRHGDSPASL
jgi:Rrf2 family protein